MNTWVTADLHLGDDPKKLLRPFETPQEHTTGIINKYNSVVGQDDLVYINGDLIHNHDIALIEQLNGEKILIRGNHERKFTDDELDPFFIDIIPEGEGIYHQNYYITHYPTKAVKTHFNLVGHVHDTWKCQFNMLNVGCDTNFLQPFNFEDIPLFIKRITEFYDDDVWVAYNEINSQFVETRGKKGRYFI